MEGNKKGAMQSDKFCRSNRPAYKKYSPINYLKVTGTKFSVHSVKGLSGETVAKFNSSEK